MRFHARNPGDATLNFRHLERDGSPARGAPPSIPRPRDIHGEAPEGRDGGTQFRLHLRREEKRELRRRRAAARALGGARTSGDAASSATCPPPCVRRCAEGGDVQNRGGARPSAPPLSNIMDDVLASPCPNDGLASSQTMTQGCDLTQLGLEEDDNDVAPSQSDDCTSPAPVDPLTVPWGRLMPVGPGNGSVVAEEAFLPRGCASRAAEMLPRSPSRAGSIATRSRSPSVGSHNSPQRVCSSIPPCVRFLGLRNLLPSDRFNEYVLGRSAKVSPRRPRWAF